MHHMFDALIKGHARANRKNQDSYHKAPEINFFAMAEWKTFVGGPLGTLQAVQ